MKIRTKSYAKPYVVYGFSVSLLLSMSAVWAEDDKKNVAKVAVTGANEALQKNILALLPSRKPSCDASQKEVDRFLKSAKKSVVKAGRGLGYYQLQSNANAKQQNNCWLLQYYITPGKVVTVESVETKLIGEGKQEADFKAIFEQPIYRIGEELQQNKYDAFKSSLQDVATSQGYFDAEFTEHQIEINLDNNTAKVKLHFDTGKRYRYGDITVKQDVLGQKHLERYLQIKKGEPYSSDQLSEQQLYLQTTGYYADVIIKSNVDQAQNFQVPLELSLLSQKRNVYTYSVGYGTDTGVRASAKMKRRWVNDKGHKLDAEVKASEKYSLIGAKYTVPLHHPRTEHIAYNLSIIRDEGDDIRSTSAEIGAEYVHRIKNGAKQTLSVKYLEDETEVPGDPKSESNYLLLGARMEKVKRNDATFPTKGYKIGLDLQAAYGDFLSSQSIFRAKLDLKHLQPLGKGKLISRASYGHVEADDFSLLPQSLRFFAGGRNTIRGYDFESLGETNAQGSNIGAKTLLAMSLEYNHPVVEKWQAAAFVDAGNAFNDWDDAIKYGVGFGARWQSPVGAVKVDLAWPEDNLEDPHLHLSIGPEL